MHADALQIFGRGALEQRQVVPAQHPQRVERIGGICIGVVQSLSSYYIAPAYGQMFFFILFLLVMIVRPAGLLGRKGEATLGMSE